jgi:hypothetical protein
VSSHFRSGPRSEHELGVSRPFPYGERHDRGGFNGLEWSAGFRTHRVGIEEFLEEWYDRSAENCDLFYNVSEVDKYCVTCTVCGRFQTECFSLDSRGPSIISLLKACYRHDSYPH